MKTADYVVRSHVSLEVWISDSIGISLDAGKLGELPIVPLVYGL